MKNNKCLLFIFIGLFIFSVQAQAQNMITNYTLNKIISLPGNGGHDYLYINPVSQHLYVTHGTHLDVINLNSKKYIGAIDKLGDIHGVAIDNKLNRGFVSDNGKRSVDVFNPKTLKLIKIIPLKGKDEDATILDPVSNKVFVFEGDSRQVEVIDPETLKEVAVIPLGGKPEFAVSNDKGLIYNNLEDIHKVAVIDVHTMKVIKKYDLGPCKKPSGMALDKMNHRIFAGCRANEGLTVLNAISGDIIQTLPVGAGNDAVKYDPTTHLIFVSCKDATTTVIKQNSPNQYKVVQILKTQMDARTMALDHQTHNIYLSTSEFKDHDEHQTVPNSFKVLVYKMK